MKKLLILSVFIASLVSCSKQVYEKPIQPANCYWEINKMNVQTIIEKQLSVERLLESKVSIGSEIDAQLPTEHYVDSSGRHNFFLKGIKLPTNSIGLITSAINTGNDIVLPTQSVSVRFEQKDFNEKDLISVTLNFDLLQKEQPKFVKANEVKSASPGALKKKGWSVDAMGYLRTGKDHESYLVRDSGGKLIVYSPSSANNEGSGRYILQLAREGDVAQENISFPTIIDSDGFIRSLKGNYLIVNQEDGQAYSLLSSPVVFLDQIKSRICDETKVIKTKGFDDKI